jgi:hypothetical protein
MPEIGANIAESTMRVIGLFISFGRKNTTRGIGPAMTTTIGAGETMIMTMGAVTSITTTADT